MRRTEVSGSQADLLVSLAQRVDRDHPFPVCRRAWRERGLARRGRTRVRKEEEEEEVEEGLFKADAVNEEDPVRDRATPA